MVDQQDILSYECQLRQHRFSDTSKLVLLTWVL